MKKTVNFFLKLTFTIFSEFSFFYYKSLTKSTFYINLYSKPRQITDLEDSDRSNRQRREAGRSRHSDRGQSHSRSQRTRSCDLNSLVDRHRSGRPPVGCTHHRSDMDCSHRSPPGHSHLA